MVTRFSTLAHRPHASSLSCSRHVRELMYSELACFGIGDNRSSMACILAQSSHTHRTSLSSMLMAVWSPWSMLVGHRRDAIGTRSDVCRRRQGARISRACTTDPACMLWLGHAGGWSALLSRPVPAITSVNRLCASKACFTAAPSRAADSMVKMISSTNCHRAVGSCSCG